MTMRKGRWYIERTKGKNYRGRLGEVNDVGLFIPHWGKVCYATVWTKRSDARVVLAALRHEEFTVRAREATKAKK